MKKFIFAVTIVFAQITPAHEFKTADICSSKTADICAHIGYDKKPTEKEKFEFTFDIVNKKKAQLVKDVKIKAYSIKTNGEREYYSATWTMRPDGHHWDAKTDQAPNNKIVGVQMSYLFNDRQEEIIVDIK